MEKTDRRYQLGTEENQAFTHALAEELLSFGERFPSPGGSSYYLGDDGSPWTERPRETWITSRMVHSYCLGILMGHPGSDALADAGLRGLTGELRDRKAGGWYAGVNAQGEPLPDKQCYMHAFVILAAASAVQVGRPGAKELLDEALATFDRFFWDEQLGLSCDTWDTDFTKLDDYRGLNANMHTVEAFLAVADVLRDEKYRVRAGRIIDHVIGWAGANDWRIPEHYTRDWEPDLERNRDKPDDPFKPYGATPGHGIEWARLITQWAVSTHIEGGRWTGGSAVPTDDPAYPYIEAAERLFTRALADAWNADGERGICYTTDWSGTPVVHDRMHWTLAEGINTAAVLYAVTGKEKYADAYADFMHYLDEVVLDKVTGSWISQLDRHNQPLDTVWPGKPDLYHALQSMLIPRYPVGISIVPALGEGQRG